MDWTGKGTRGPRWCPPALLLPATLGSAGLLARDLAALPEATLPGRDDASSECRQGPQVFAGTVTPLILGEWGDDDTSEPVKHETRPHILV